MRCLVGCAETAVGQDGGGCVAGSGAVPMLVSGNARIEIVGKYESCMIMITMLVSAPPSDSRSHTRHGDDGGGDGATGAVFRAAPPVSMTLRFDESLRHKL